MKMSDEDYFAHPGVSNSKLQLLNKKQGGSHLKYLNGFDEEKSYRAALETGTNIHLAILEPERYVVSETMKPSGKISVVVERAFYYREKGETILSAIEKGCVDANYGQSYNFKTRLKKVLEGGLAYYGFLMKRTKMVCMSEQVYESVTKAVASVHANPEAMRLMNPPERDVFNENAYFKQYAVQVQPPNMDIPILGELTLKCKVDNWSIDHINKIVTLNDLKSTSSPIDLFDGYLEEYPYPRYIMGSFQKWHYYRQMAFYLDILKTHVHKHYGDGFTYEVNMIVVETRPPFQCRVFAVSDETLEYGRKEYRQLLDELGRLEILGPEVITSQTI